MAGEHWSMTLLQSGEKFPAVMPVPEQVDSVLSPAAAMLSRALPGNWNQLSLNPGAISKKGWA